MPRRRLCRQLITVGTWSSRDETRKTTTVFCSTESERNLLTEQEDEEAEYEDDDDDDVEFK